MFSSDADTDIGFHIARRLAFLGFKVVILGKSRAKIELIAEQMKKIVSKRIDDPDIQVDTLNLASLTSVMRY